MGAVAAEAPGTLSHIVPVFRLPAASSQDKYPFWLHEMEKLGFKTDWCKA